MKNSIISFLKGHGRGLAIAVIISMSVIAISGRSLEVGFTSGDVSFQITLK